MHSLTDLIVKTTPREPEDQRQANPVACAVFIAMLAVGVTGGALWLTSAVVDSNAQAASLMTSFE